MAAVKGDRTGPEPGRRDYVVRCSRIIAFALLLQAGLAMADPVTLDAPAVLAADGVAALGSGLLRSDREDSDLEDSRPQMICEQLRARGTERCRPVSRLAQAQGAPPLRSARRSARGSPLAPGASLPAAAGER